MRKDGAYVKTQRIQEIKKQIVKCFPAKVSFRKIQLWSMMNQGLTEQTSTRYIENLIEAEGWHLTLENEIVAEAREIPSDVIKYAREAKKE